MIQGQLYGKSETSRLFGDIGVQTILASALFWSWYDMAVYRPTLFIPFTDSIELYRVFFLVTMTFGAVPLAAAAFKPEVIEPLLHRGRTWISTTVIALVGAGIAMLSASFGSVFLAVLAGVLIGWCCGVFQLVWSVVYAHQGARTAGLLISLSIGVGSLLDFSFIGLPSFPAVICTAVLPLVSLVLVMSSSFITGKALGHQSNDAVPSNIPEGDPITLNSIFEGSRVRVLGLSLALMMAFFIYGLSFAYDQYINVFSGLTLDPGLSDVFLMARGLTTLVIFFAVYLLPGRMYTVFRIGILIGLAGCVMSPTISLMLGNSVVSGAFIAVGYATIDVITWTLLSEVAYRTREGVSSTLGPGRLAIHVGIVVGFLLIYVLAADGANAAQFQAIDNTVALLMVVAEVLLLGESSGLWILVRMNIPASQSGAGAAQGAIGIVEVARAHELTEREVDVLRLLIAGRSRARIAQNLGISENTVNSHVQQIYRKLDVHNRQEILDLFS